MLADTINKGAFTRNQADPPEYGLMTDLQKDVELVRRIAAKEEAALHELYACYGQSLYAFALRLTGETAQAEDVVQDALVAVWNSARSYRSEGRVLTWLLGIVHHIALKSLRHRSAPLTEELESTLSAPEPLLEEQVQASEQARWIQQGLQSLSFKHRVVLELVFYQGLSLSEIARVCGCSVGTVKSRLSYARQQLRGVLRRLEDPDE